MTNNAYTYTLDDYESFEIDECSGYRICPSGDYSHIKEFKGNCMFDDDCIFGNDVKFPPCYSFGDRCKFGNNCTFGSAAIFGDYCVFGRGNRFGKYTTFGSMCLIRG